MIGLATNASDERWLLIAPLIPRPKTGGRLRTSNERRVVDAIHSPPAENQL
jgi:transposase